MLHGRLPKNLDFSIRTYGNTQTTFSCLRTALYGPCLLRPVRALPGGCRAAISSWAAEPGVWALVPNAPRSLVFCCVDPRSQAAGTVRPVPSSLLQTLCGGFHPMGERPSLSLRKRSGLRGHLGAEEAEVGAGCLGGGKSGNLSPHYRPQHIADEKIGKFTHCHPERDSGPRALCSGGSLCRLHARLRGSQGPCRKGRTRWAG